MEDALLIGEKLPGTLYAVVKKIGICKDSVFSQIYIVENTHSGSRYIFKVNMTDDEVIASSTIKNRKVSPTVESIIGKMDYQSRVQNEISVLKELNKESHPNICTYHDHIKFGNRVGLLLDKVTACETLAERFRTEKKQPETYADVILSKMKVSKSMLIGLDLSEQLIDTLNFLVSKGHIHKDIKPGNIIVDGFNKLKLIDFGLACPVKKPNGLWGTRAYSPPERYLGIEHRFSDLWSGAIIVNELTFGNYPFGIDSDKIEEHIRNLNNDKEARQKFESQERKTEILLDTVEKAVNAEIKYLYFLSDKDRELPKNKIRILTDEAFQYFLFRIKPVFYWFYHNLKVDPEQRDPQYQNKAVEQAKKTLSVLAEEFAIKDFIDKLKEDVKKQEEKISELEKQKNKLEKELEDEIKKILEKQKIIKPS